MVHGHWEWFSSLNLSSSIYCLSKDDNIQSKVLEGLDLSGAVEVLLNLEQVRLLTWSDHRQFGKQKTADCVLRVLWLAMALLFT